MVSGKAYDGLPMKRIPMRVPVCLENAQPTLNARKRMFPTCRTCYDWGTYVSIVMTTCGALLTHVRPYISDNGAKNRGPNANESRNMLRVMAVIVSLTVFSCSAILGRAGDMMALARGETKVYSAT